MKPSLRKVVSDTSKAVRSGPESQRRAVQAAQEMGRAYEQEWAEIVGGKPTPGSGNKWWSKLDVRDKIILWSLKWTSKDRFTLTEADLNETFCGTDSIGGENAIPALGLHLGKHDVVILRRSDFVALMKEDTRYIPQTKAEAKVARAKLPILFRDE